MPGRAETLQVKDPELNLNIVDLGLVYEITVDGSDVQVDMTLTSPGCPAGPQIMGDVERAVKGARRVDGEAQLGVGAVLEIPPRPPPSHSTNPSTANRWASAPGQTWNCDDDRGL